MRTPPAWKVNQKEERKRIKWATKLAIKKIEKEEKRARKKDYNRLAEMDKFWLKRMCPSSREFAKILFLAVSILIGRKAVQKRRS